MAREGADDAGAAVDVDGEDDAGDALDVGDADDAGGAVDAGEAGPDLAGAGDADAAGGGSSSAPQAVDETRRPTIEIEPSIQLRIETLQ